MDELAYALGVDPVALRIRNHTDLDPRRQPVVERRSRGVPAARRRALRLEPTRPDTAVEPRRQLADRHRDGVGRLPDGAVHARAARAVRAIYADGSAVVQTGTQEIGTGVTDDGDPGRGRRARRRPRGDALPGRRHRPAQHVGGGRVGGLDDGQRRRCTPAATALRDQLVALAIADAAIAAARSRPRRRGGRRRAHGAPRPARHRRDLRRAAAAQPHDRRRGDRQLDPAAAGRAVRAADVRRAVRRGRRRPGARPGPRAPAGRRVRTRARPQPAARAQPAHGRDALGPGPGAARGQPAWIRGAAAGRARTSRSTSCRSTPTPPT